MEEPKAPSSSADRDRPRQKPLDFALRRLGRRAHSEGELSEKMLRAGYSAQEVQSTLDHLRSRRYLDDAAFARAFARSASEHKRWGPGRIERRLRELRLSENHIQQALSEAFPSGEEAAAALALEHHLRRSGRREGSSRTKARAYRHLLSRGFSPSIARRLVSEMDFEDTGEEQA